MGRPQNFEATLEIITNVHHSPRVIELPAVIRHAEYSHEGPVRLELVTVLDDLVGAADEVEVVGLEELVDDVVAEGVGHTAGVAAPAGYRGVRVGPEEVAEEALVGDVRRAGDLEDLAKPLEVGREAAVHAQNFVLDAAGDRHAVEGVGEDAPELDAVTALALVVEAVDAVQGGAFVVAAKEEELVGVLYFVAEEEGDCFYALLGSINVISHEDIIAFRRKSSSLKQTEQVVELPVGVSANVYGSVDL